MQIAEGSDADVVIFDPALEHTISAASHHSAMDTNIYEGYRVQGKVGSLFARVLNHSSFASLQLCPEARAHALVVC